MPDQPKPSRGLSEISHLFLSSVRDRQTNGAPRPQRRPPPPQGEMSVDLTPEEFAEVFGDHDPAPVSAARPETRVAAVIAGHLNDRQFDYVKDYARHLAAGGLRVGLIGVDSSEFRLMRFERGTQSGEGEAPTSQSFDPRRMVEAIDELSCDVDQWLLALPNPRLPEARALLREVDHWVLLSTCDHDGIVSCYRALKGLSDLHRPVLSLALLDAQDEATAGRVFRKLATVCRQFLHWPLHAEPAIRPAADVAEHEVMCCRPTRDKAQLAASCHWQIAANFLAKTKTMANPASHPAAAGVSLRAPMTQPRAADSRQFVADISIPQPAAEPPVSHATKTPEIAMPAPVAQTLPSAPPAAAHAEVPGGACEVIDLPGPDLSRPGIITAILRHSSNELVECPVRPPTCPDARLAVDRDRHLTLLAVADKGLSDLRAIGQAYQWMTQNRALIAMAVPQFAIDAHRLPRLRLLVDQADVSAEILQPMLQSGNVSVQAYRKLTWGQKTGLLLEAA